MDFVVFDLETTGLDPNRDEIIEIGAVLWQQGEITAAFHSLVNPGLAIPLEIQQLTGITDSDVADAPRLETILPEFLRFLEGRRLAGHNVRFDIRFLLAACERSGYELPAEREGLDTLLAARVLLPTVSGYKLGDLVRGLEIGSHTAHRALADATQTAEVLRVLEDRAVALPYLTLQQLTRLAGMFSPMLATWFQGLSEVRVGRTGTRLEDGQDALLNLVFTTSEHERRFRQEEGTIEHFDADVAATSLEAGSSSSPRSSQPILAAASALLAQGTPLQQVLPGFEVRTGQLEMVQAVAQALEGNQHLLVEAGTGTGKSLAYLIPAALYALAEDTRVVVSTHTIALQDQIRDRDFATLRKVLNQPVSLKVFKGRTHYVCMRKLNQELTSADFGTPSDDLIAYMAFLVWLTFTQEGNREELPLSGNSAEVWPRIQSESETCIGKRCPFFKPCYYFRARGAAYDADVVVTNHSLVFSDLKAEHRVLPKYNHLIFDEAHHVEEVATRHLGEEVHLLQLLALFGRLVRDYGRHGILPELLSKLELSESRSASVVGSLQKLLDAVAGLRPRTEHAFLVLSRYIPRGQYEVRITSDLTETPSWDEFNKIADEIADVLHQMEDPRSQLEDSAELETDEDLQGRLFDASGFLSELSNHLWMLCKAGDLSESWVNWVEISGNSDSKQVSLHRNPISVAGILAEQLFATKQSVVLTSATLSTEGKFDYVKNQLGLEEAERDGRLASQSVASPFNFAKQALLCVPSDVPELAKMNTEEASTYLADAIYQLAKASQGRLMALFTSHAMLRQTAAMVRDPLKSLKMELFAQGIDGNRWTLLESFRKHPSGVLFGAQSFWEGIDLPGDELTTLVIVRLPFAPPTHPVTAARHQRLEAAGKSAFWHASLPEAVVRFRQGFGRLIRTVNDRGVVVVYDKRIVSTRYGASFVRSLHGIRPFVAPEQQVIERVQAFLAKS